MNNLSQSRGLLGIFEVKFEVFLGHNDVNSFILLIYIYSITIVNSFILIIYMIVYS